MANDIGGQQPKQQASSSESHLAPLLAGITVPVTVVVGHGQIPLRTLLDLAPGAVLELDCNVGDPVEISVGGQIIAHGELVSINGQLGVRVIEILAPQGETQQ